MPENTYKPVARRQDIVTQELNKEILIYDLLINKAFSLNETSSLVWYSCDGTKTVGEISSEIGRKLKSTIGEDFVWLALEQLQENDLLEGEIKTPESAPRLSRREAVRRVGLATFVALPLITSLVAPLASHAQSAVVVVTCSTAAPGGVLCRCAVGDVPSVGDNCGTNTVLDPCNAGCICRRTAATCSTTGGTAGTCQGNCVAA